ncbi:hypothetical protein NXY56_004667 [Leishmania guyanensis]|uniref:Uncharacterized protein n=1 Tax=Leishmania guyanensis TaxID=5670 RepID=A0A1E1J0V6_LEIGU|nr:hypothetical protein, conserved [Leishmania guyanensis]
MDSFDTGATLASSGSSVGAAYPAEAQSLKAAADGDTSDSSAGSPLAVGGPLQAGEGESSVADTCSTMGKEAGDDAVAGNNEGDAAADYAGAEDDKMYPEGDDGEEEDAEYVEEDAEYEEKEHSDEEAYEPEEAAADASVTPSSASPKPLIITVGTRQYKASAFVKNRGLSYVPGRLKSNPKATFEPCTTNAPHSILDCQKLHLNNRGVLVRDRFIRLNMLVDNPGKKTLLHNPGRSQKMRICRRNVEPEKSETHSPATCSDLHLLPDIVFVGIPGLRTAYFEAELRHNLAFTKLKEAPWETQCGTWCRSTRSHVVTTCRFLHYNRGDNYTEKPTPPHRPLAAIPDLTPSRPPQVTDLSRRGRGRGGRGGGRGRGNCRGRGRGGRGAAAIPLPAAFQPGYVAPSQDSSSPGSSITTGSSGAANRMKHSLDALEATGWMTNKGDDGRTINYWVLNVLFVLLGVFVFLLAVALRRVNEPAAAAS